MYAGEPTDCMVLMILSYKPQFNEHWDEPCMTCGTDMGSPEASCTKYEFFAYLVV